MCNEADLEHQKLPKTHGASEYLSIERLIFFRIIISDVYLYYHELWIYTLVYTYIEFKLKENKGTQFLNVDLILNIRKDEEEEEENEIEKRIVVYIALYCYYSLAFMPGRFTRFQDVVTFIDSSLESLS